MQTVLSEAMDWLKGSRFGYTRRIEYLVHVYFQCYCSNNFFIAIYGKVKTIEISLKRTYLLNWIPISESVLIKRDGILLSFPMILDYSSLSNQIGKSRKGS